MTGVRNELARDERVVVAEHRHPRDPPEPARTERRHRVAQQPDVARGVDVGAVVERVGIPLELDPVVAVGPAPGRHDAAAENRKRVGELVVLDVVDQVAALDDEIRRQRPNGRQGAGEHLRRQRLLRAEGRLERGPEPVQKRDARRRGRVQHVGIGDMGERSRGPRSPGRRDRARHGRPAAPRARRRAARRRSDRSTSSPASTRTRTGSSPPTRAPADADPPPPHPARISAPTPAPAPPRKRRRVVVAENSLTTTPRRPTPAPPRARPTRPRSPPRPRARRTTIRISEIPAASGSTA